jgi:hypothetical protein
MIKKSLRDLDYDRNGSVRVGDFCELLKKAGVNGFDMDIILSINPPFEGKVSYPSFLSKIK